MPALESLTSAAISIYGNPVLDGSMMVAAEYAVFASFVVLAFLWLRKEYRGVTVAMAAGVAGVAVSYLFGMVHSHQGPYVAMQTLLQDPVAENTFPSQHTALAFSLAFGLFKRNRRYGYVLLALAVLTGLGRFYTGLHWAVDIAGGVLAAAAGFAVVYLFEDEILRVADPFIEIYDRYSLFQ